MKNKILRLSFPSRNPGNAFGLFSFSFVLKIISRRVRRLWADQSNFGVPDEARSYVQFYNVLSMDEMAQPLDRALANIRLVGPNLVTLYYTLPD